MSQIFNIFNFDNPICLYCNHACTISSWGKQNDAQESYICKSCNEKFEFVYSDDKLVSIVFSCEDIQVVHLLEIQSFGIQKIDLQESQPLNRVWVPEFFIDFADKQSLKIKLGTYLLFC